jgi:hypothetical protein
MACDGRHPRASDGQEKGESVVSDNERRWRQEPFAQFLRRIGIGNACNVALGGMDPPFIPAMEVSSEEVLNHFLATHQDRVQDRDLFVELLHGRTLISVNRDLWPQLTAI